VCDVTRDVTYWVDVGQCGCLVLLQDCLLLRRFEMAQYVTGDVTYWVDVGRCWCLVLLQDCLLLRRFEMAQYVTDAKAVEVWEIRNMYFLQCVLLVWQYLKLSTVPHSWVTVTLRSACGLVCRRRCIEVTVSRMQWVSYITCKCRFASAEYTACKPTVTLSLLRLNIPPANLL
jgi:hypothetical protein